PPRPPHPHHLPLHDALPICAQPLSCRPRAERQAARAETTPRSTTLSSPTTIDRRSPPALPRKWIGTPAVRARWSRRARLSGGAEDRKSTRLNSSHGSISYAV